MSKRAIQPIENEKVRLRLLHEGDLPLTLRWRNQDHIRRWFIHSDIITPEQHAGWFRQYQERDDDFVFIIEDRGADNQPVGQASIYHIDWAAGRAEYGRLLIGEAQASGKGLAVAATQAAIQIAFEGLGLQELYMEVYADNVRSIAACQHAGFRVTGRAADMQYMAVRRVDSPDKTFI
jgi:RimJ/RimL family protein N-acetyltransferase